MLTILLTIIGKLATKDNNIDMLTFPGRVDKILYYFVVRTLLNIFTPPPYVEKSANYSVLTFLLWFAHLCKGAKSYAKHFRPCGWALLSHSSGIPLELRGKFGQMLSTVILAY